MVPDPEKTCLGLEYFCFEGDELWTMSEQELIELGKKELEALGLARECDVEDGTIVRMPKAYPIYDQTYYKNLMTIRQYLDRFSNLQTIGRNGLHRYNNQDHSMMTGIYAARNVIGANYDVWSVNTEMKYHEEGFATESKVWDNLATTRAKTLVMSP